MYNKIKEQNINKLFFLAREGNLLKKSFNILYQNSSVSNMLISVSRKATVVPLLQSANSFDDILKIIYVARTNYTLKELYEFLGLDKAEIDTICIKTSISEHKSIYCLKSKRRLFLILQGLI